MYVILCYCMFMPDMCTSMFLNMFFRFLKYVLISKFVCFYVYIQTSVCMAHAADREPATAAFWCPTEPLNTL